MGSKGVRPARDKEVSNQDLVATLRRLDSERENWVGGGEGERKKIKTQL